MIGALIYTVPSKLKGKQNLLPQRAEESRHDKSIEFHKKCHVIERDQSDSVSLTIVDAT